MGEINIKTPGSEVIELEVTSKSEFQRLTEFLHSLILKDNPSLDEDYQDGMAALAAKKRFLEDGKFVTIDELIEDLELSI